MITATRLVIFLMHMHNKIKSESLYNISFTDLVSGKICNSDVIPASSCVDGACTHTFNILVSSCPNNTDIDVIVAATDSGFSTSIKIGLSFLHLVVKLVMMIINNLFRCCKQFYQGSV